MSTSFKIEGFDDIFNEIEHMEISSSKKRRALNNAGDILIDGIEPNLPKLTGRYRKGLGKQIKQLPEGLSVIVNSKAFYDIFEEFGTSKSKKNVGSFEKGVNSTADKAVEAAIKELIT